MPPTDPSCNELTWSWAWSTGHHTSDRKLESAAKAAWPYALLCAWTYLYDRDSAHNLMDHAVRNTAEYLTRHPESPDWKLIARLKSMIRRRAKQVAHKHSREISWGSLFELEHLLIELPDLEERSIAIELFSRLTPFTRSVLNRRYIGYTWREIAAELELDHTVVRRAYFRELESLLRALSQSGESRP